MSAALYNVDDNDDNDNDDNDNDNNNDDDTILWSIYVVLYILVGCVKRWKDKCPLQAGVPSIC